MNANDFLLFVLPPVIVIVAVIGLFMWGAWSKGHTKP
jgi:hypothetical protein